MKIALDDRLRLCLDAVSGSDCVCDVGCDHGKLAVSALLLGKAKRAIATDISAASLSKAANLAERAGVQLDLRLGDGLKVIAAGEADTVVIAGMGGYEIAKILSEAPCRFNKYVLVPHQHPQVVRRLLKEADARILRDVMTKVGKHYYSVITCTYSEGWLPTHNVYAGEDGEVFREYRRFRLGQLDKIALHCGESQVKEEREVLLGYDKN